jgi:hypothetical protein
MQVIHDFHASQMIHEWFVFSNLFINSSPIESSKIKTNGCAKCSSSNHGTLLDVNTSSHNKGAKGGKGLPPSSWL